MGLHQSQWHTLTSGYFSDDCQRKKTELFDDFHVLPDDLTIERMVLEEKRKELEERRESV